jgi:hypothetical protein
VEVQDSAGNFRVRLQTSQEVRKEIVGAIILAPELSLSPGEAATGAASHPRVLTQSRLEDLLASPKEAALLNPPEADRLRVAFLGGDSHPLALARTLSAARRLTSRDNCQVFLFIRDAKVGAPDMEAALGQAQSAGLVVFKLPQLPTLALAEDRPRLTFLIR